MHTYVYIYMYMHVHARIHYLAPCEKYIPFFKVSVFFQFPIISSLQVERESINIFCFSKLWQSQCVSSPARAIEEHAFIVPGSGASCVAASHEGRRNLTDVQETGQWLGGEQIPELIINDLLACGYLPSLCSLL